MYKQTLKFNSPSKLIERRKHAQLSDQRTRSRETGAHAHNLLKYMSQLLTNISNIALIV